jgi:hypothetical protein
MVLALRDPRQWFFDSYMKPTAELTQENYDY